MIALKNIVIFSLWFVVSTGDDCIYESIDLSVIQSVEPLVPWTVKNGTFYEYTINLCSSLVTPNDCHDKPNTGICRKDITTGETVSMGKLDSVETTKDDTDSELWITFTGDSVGDSVDCEANNYRTIFYLRCGKSLGSPVLVTSYACDTIFEWDTTAMCKDPKADLNQVQCYVYNNNEKIDLNYLAMEPSRSIQVGENQEFKFSVCKSLEDKVDGTGAYLNTRGSGPASILVGGKPTRRLKLENGDAVLEYSQLDTPEHCENPPHTTITFICPERGGSKDPQLVSQNGCQFVVVWETEHACPESLLTAHECKLTRAQHNVDFDLTSLTKDSGFYSDNDSDEQFDYKVNICGPVEGCGASAPPHVAACQLKTSSDETHVLGTLQDKTLKYADGVLTLTYKHGDKCHSTNFQRQTIIEFVCPENVEDENKLVHIKEDACTYYFRLSTSTACVDTRENQCLFTDGDKQFDISPIQRLSGDDWVAITGEDEIDNTFYINPCGSVLQANCHDRGLSETCMYDKEKDEYIDIGNRNGRVADIGDGRITLQYDNGDTCSGETKYSSTIILICAPGLLTSSPLLMSTSDDSCHFEFEWRTAAACVQADATGEHCRVYDDALGFDFDLSPLSRDSGYAVSDDQYTYKINVCSPLDECDGTVEHAGVCQTRKDNGGAHNAGQANDVVQYHHGMLKLTYIHGDVYSSGDARTSEIIFICDESAGLGNPAFPTESGHTYTFDWLTMYACPVIPSVDCSVKNGDDEYDLSRLTAASITWVATDDEGVSERTLYYLSVCGPLALADDSPALSCARGAAVCSVRETADQDAIENPNLGKALSGPEIIDKGHLRLTFTEGGECKDDGTTFESILDLICERGALGTPEFKGIEDCTYKFEWKTDAACPIGTDEKTVNETTCQLHDDNLDFTFNLLPLKKNTDEAYTVNGYKLNICGLVNCGSQKGETSATVCKDETVHGSLDDDTKLEYSREVLTLTYKSSGSQSTEISFICDHSVVMGEPVFVEQDGSTLKFDFATSLACAPGPVDCLITDADGQQYDLSSLRRTDANWQTFDQQHPDTKYYINICAPVVPVGCPDGGIGGCQTTPDGNHSMGYVQSMPLVSDSGTIIVTYLGGDECHKNDKDKHSWRSTRIELSCSKLEHQPQFQFETDTCDYMIKWDTPAACPLEPARIGDDCTYPHDDYGLLDLRSLMRGSDWVVRANDHWYRLNVCAQLNDGTREGCKDDVAVCQIDYGNTTFIDAGHQNQTVTYEDGQIVLEYNDGKICHGQYPRQTKITFLCDFKADGLDGPEFIREDDECTYYFEWATSLACPSDVVLPVCEIYAESGSHYDLSSLTLYNDNYEVAGPVGSGQRFLINVCGPVVPGKEATCPSNAAVCMTEDASETLVGDLSQMTLREEANHHLVLEYEYTKDGATCKTSISLFCGRGAEAEQAPMYMYQEDGCSYYFSWTVPEACAIEDAAPQGGCKATNPATGREFDLSGLKKAEGYTMDDEHGRDFVINVCGPVSGAGCDADVGACQKERSSDRTFDAGKANQNLVYRDSCLYLNYTGGKRCHSDQFERNTVIEFCCDENAVNTIPDYDGETADCTYNIKWMTDLVCEEQMSCQVSTADGVIDLTPLIKQDSDYITMAETPAGEDGHTADTVFYVNVCGPLKDAETCPEGTGVCMEIDGSAKSLGRMKSGPLYDEENQKVVLEYEDGDYCATHPTMRMSASVILSCVRGPDQGSPVLRGINGCEYEFGWGTNAVCVAEEEEVTAACTYKDESTGYTFDFSSLAKPEGYEVQGTNAYSVNPCGTVTSCPSGSMVCSTDDHTSLASMTGAKFLREGDTVKLVSGEAGDCGGNKKHKAVILFTCDESKYAATAPVLYAETDCDVIFEWHTALACAPIINDCVAANGANIYELDLLSRLHGSWNVAEQNGVIYWFNLCQSVHNVPGCPKSAAMCQTQGIDSENTKTLGRLHTQDIRYTDGHVVVRYSQGDDTVCQNKIQAQVTLHLRCAKTTGSPTLSKKTDDENMCMFEFEWNTKIACEQEVEELLFDNNILKEPLSGQKIDLTTINGDGNYTVIAKSGDTYTVDLISSSQMPSECDGSAVCWKRSEADKTSTTSSVGKLNNAKYYFEGDSLDAVFSTAETCFTSIEKTVSSLIVLKCPSEYDIETHPTFEYVTPSCVHVFYWLTSEVCLNITIDEGASAHSSSHGSGGASSSTVTIVLGVVFSLLVVLLLVLIFKSPHRRASCYSRVRRVLRREGNLSYRYSQLMDDEGGDREGLLSNADQGYGSGTADLPALARDSDDDLIL